MSDVACVIDAVPGGMLTATATPADVAETFTSTRGFTRDQDTPDRFIIQPIPDSIAVLRTLTKQQRITVTAQALETLRCYACAAITEGEDKTWLLNIPAGPIVQDIKRLPGVTWNKSSNMWVIPAKERLTAHTIATTWGVPTPPPPTHLLPAFSTDGSLHALAGISLVDVHEIPPATRNKLTKAGHQTVYDLITTYPIRYLDRSNPQFITTLKDGQEAAIIGTLDSLTAGPKKGMVKATITDPSGRIPITWFSSTYLLRTHKKGDTVIILGDVSTYRGKPQFTNPLIERIDLDPDPILPIYPSSPKNKLTTWDMRAAIKILLLRLDASTPIIDPFTTYLTPAVPERAHALRAIHIPTSTQEATRARKRLAFDELFRMQLAIGITRRSETYGPPVSHEPHLQLPDLHTKLTHAYPFPLTEHQSSALDHIYNFMTNPQPMRALLQGDVGSGKTVLCVAASLIAHHAGGQTVVMAPTEILAEQLAEHFRTVDVALGGLLNPVYLGAKTTDTQKRSAYEQIATGAAHIIIGTHAVLTETVPYNNLTLVIIDEQHRFGVEQRAALLTRNPNATPDLLVMTATPIPRTAALTVYGDLDTITIPGLPPGRTPITTTWDPTEPDTTTPHPHNITTTWEHIREQITQGHQAYIITPLVEESEKLQAADATTTYENLTHGPLSGLRLGLVHGRQPSKEREHTMREFAAGNLDVLIATTVVEVGVNVPNATIIAILDPARFGISQLHQLRGRVGRAHYPSYCHLLGPALSADAHARCTALVTSTDGFYLAQRDLEIRGSGNLLGEEQSGRLHGLSAANLATDQKIVEYARTHAHDLLTNDPDLHAHPTIRSEVLHALPDKARLLLSSS